MSNNKKVDGKTLEAWCDESHENFLAGDYVKALEAAEKALTIDSQSPLALTRRGNAKGGMGVEDEAIEDHTAAIEIDPAFEIAYNNRGGTKSKQGDYEGAIADYNEAIRLKPDYVMAYNNRGVMKGLQGDYEGSIADYNEAIRLKPDYAMAYYNWGNVKYKQDDDEGAIADYERFLELAGDSESLLQRAYVEKKIKELSGQNKKKEKSDTGAAELKEEPPEELKLAQEKLAVIVVDIVGSTKMLAENGVDHFLEHVLYKLLAKSKFVAGDGVRVIKHTGDGLMMVADTVDAALNASIELVEFAEGEKFDIRIGIDYGDVKVDKNNQLGEGTEDVFGEPVIAAVRVEGIVVENGNLINPDKKDQDIDDLDSAITEGRNRILITCPAKEEARVDFRNNCCYVGHYNLKGLRGRRPIYAVNWKEIQKQQKEN